MEKEIILEKILELLFDSHGPNTVQNLSLKFDGDQDCFKIQPCALAKHLAIHFGTIVTLVPLKAANLSSRPMRWR